MSFGCKTHKKTYKSMTKKELINLLNKESLLTKASLNLNGKKINGAIYIEEYYDFNFYFFSNCDALDGTIPEGDYDIVVNSRYKYSYWFATLVDFDNEYELEGIDDMFDNIKLTNKKIKSCKIKFM